jgi:hypothetical protein
MRELAVAGCAEDGPIRRQTLRSSMPQTTSPRLTGADRRVKLWRLDPPALRRRVGIFRLFA